MTTSTDTPASAAPAPPTVDVISVDRARPVDDLAAAVGGDLTSWYPLRLVARPEGLRLIWGDLSPFELSSEGFFSRVRNRHDHDVRHGLHPSAVETSLDALGAGPRSGRWIEPTGFVFHTSHSGSTLLCNMLGASPANLAVSEPRPAQEGFRLLSGGLPADAAARDELLAAFPALFRSWGHTADPARTSYFVKLNSYHLRHADLLREWFPNARFVFVYRNPAEILAGRLRRYPHSNHIWNIEGRVVEPDAHELATTPIVDAMVETLAQLYDLARTGLLGDERAMVIDYADFAEPGYRRVFDHLGIGDDEAHVAAMVARTAHHSKEWKADLEQGDRQRFTADAERRRKELSVELQAAIAHRALPAYERLRAEAAAPRTAPVDETGPQAASAANGAAAASSDGHGVTPSAATISAATSRAGSTLAIHHPTPDGGDGPPAVGPLAVGPSAGSGSAWRYGSPVAGRVAPDDLLDLYPDRVEPLDDGPVVVFHDPADGPPSTRPDGHLLVDHHRRETLVPVSALPSIVASLPVVAPPPAVILDWSPMASLQWPERSGSAVPALRLLEVGRQLTTFVDGPTLSRLVTWFANSIARAASPEADRPDGGADHTGDGRPALVVRSIELDDLDFVIDHLPSVPVAVHLLSPLTHLTRAAQGFAARPTDRRIERVLDAVAPGQRLRIGPLEAHAHEYAALAAAVRDRVADGRVVLLEAEHLAPDHRDRFEAAVEVPSFHAPPPAPSHHQGQPVPSLGPAERDAVVALVERHGLIPFEQLKAAARPRSAPTPMTVLDI